MLTIRFLSSGIDRTVTVDTATGPTRTLLGIAKQHRVPVLFNCESGACGACLVSVEDGSADATGLAPPGAAEISFLEVTDNLPPDDSPPDAPRYRLACVATAGEGTVVVRFSNRVRYV